MTKKRPSVDLTLDVGALPAIGNGIIVCCLILYIYAILGISIFKGKFYNCALEHVYNT